MTQSTLLFPEFAGDALDMTRGVAVCAAPAAGGSVVRRALETWGADAAPAPARGGGRLLVALVRNPVNRVAAMYEALARGDAASRAWFPDPALARDLTQTAQATDLKEFARHAPEAARRVLHEAQSRAVAEALGADPEELFGDVDGLATRLAERFDFVGVYEYLPLAVQLLGFRLGLTPDLAALGLPPTGTLWRDAGLDPETREAILDLNRRDELLWRHAQDAFLAALDAMQRRLLECEYIALRETELSHDG